MLYCGIRRCSESFCRKSWFKPTRSTYTGNYEASSTMVVERHSGKRRSTITTKCRTSPINKATIGADDGFFFLLVSLLVYIKLSFCYIVMYVRGEDTQNKQVIQYIRIMLYLMSSVLHSTALLLLQAQTKIPEKHTKEQKSKPFCKIAATVWKTEWALTRCW